MKASSDSKKSTNPMFTLQEVALAYAIAAERIATTDIQGALVPVFVNILLQSLEITLKAVAIDSGLATESTFRNKKFCNGHGIKEIAEHIEAKLNGQSIVDLLLPKWVGAPPKRIVKIMLFDEKFELTRISYAKRTLAYSSFEQGQLQLICVNSKAWVSAVRKAAERVTVASDHLKKQISGAQTA